MPCCVLPVACHLVNCIVDSDRPFILFTPMQFLICERHKNHLLTYNKARRFFILSIKHQIKIGSLKLPKSCVKLGKKREKSRRFRPTEPITKPWVAVWQSQTCSTYPPAPAKQKNTKPIGLVFFCFTAALCDE